MKHITKLIFLTITSLILASCGFHLRGIQKVSPQLKKLYIQSTRPNSSFIQNLRRILKANNIKLVNNKKEANSILNIIKINQTSHLTSLTGAAEAGQYTLNMLVTFSVTDKKSHQILVPTNVSTSRQFNSNATQTLSANAKRQQLSNDMQLQLGSSILEQLTKV